MLTMMSTHRALFKKQWSVRIQDKYAHGKGVILYLARYMKGGPINPNQIISCNNTISFYYKDHRDQRTKILHLKLTDFIKRILWHVPEIGVHVVRHYGLYASKNQEKRDICREVIGGLMESGVNAGQNIKDTVNWCCEVCGQPLQKAFSTFQSDSYENSFIKNTGRIHVQQFVHTDIANALRIRGPCRI